MWGPGRKANQIKKIAPLGRLAATEKNCKKADKES
jgi:hypothetical protein